MEKENYKKIIILGKGLKSFPEKKDSKTLIIGNGNVKIVPNLLRQILQENASNIDKDAVFLIKIHGRNTKKYKGHYNGHNHNNKLFTVFNNNIAENTQGLIAEIKNFTNSLNLVSDVSMTLTNIVLSSCYAGTVQHIKLPPNTLIFALGTRSHGLLDAIKIDFDILDLIEQDRSYHAVSKLLAERGETTYIIKKEELKKTAQIIKLRRVRKEYNHTDNGILDNLKKNYSEFEKIFATHKQLNTLNVSDKTMQIIKINTLFNSIFKGKTAQIKDSLKNSFNIQLPPNTQENKLRLFELLQTQDDNGFTALHWALPLRHQNIIELLLKDLNTPEKTALFQIKDNYENTPLHIASCKRYKAIMELFLKDLNATEKTELFQIKDNHGNTPLHIASYEGNQNIMELLLKDLNTPEKIALFQIKDNHGNTPLHFASCEGHKDIIEMLLNDLNTAEKTALFQIKDNHGNTPLHFVSYKGHKDIIEISLKDLNTAQKISILQVQNTYGSTPLHLIFQFGHKDIIEMLLNDLNTAEKTALFQIKDSDGNTPLDLQ